MVVLFVTDLVDLSGRNRTSITLRLELQTSAGTLVMMALVEQCSWVLVQ
jgi:hypothetical protein